MLKVAVVEMGVQRSSFARRDLLCKFERAVEFSAPDHALKRDVALPRQLVELRLGAIVQETRNGGSAANGDQPGDAAVGIACFDDPASGDQTGANAVHVDYRDVNRRVARPRP